MRNRYDYEESEKFDKVTKRNKIIVIALLVISLIALIILVTRGCSKNIDNKKKNFEYESDLLAAGKKFYSLNEHLLPKEIGQCESVTLNILMNEAGLVKPKNYGSCNVNDTYVRVCKIENGGYQWTPWLTCQNYNSESLYGTSHEGTINDLKEDSYVSFKYLPQVMGEDEVILGEEEEIWKDDIKYQNYKTLETITYYSYKDEQWIWNTISKKYYNGDSNEYYVSSPASGYTSKDSETTVYKWYTTPGQKEEYFSAYSETAPAGYPYKDESSKSLKKYYNAIVAEELATHYYLCAKPGSSYTIAQKEKCNNGVKNPAYTVQLGERYECPQGYTPNSTTISAITVCQKLGPTTNTCSASNGKCKVSTKVVYRWYRLVESDERSYIPSGSKYASGENVYYASSPSDGAKRDDSTKKTGYKWYTTLTGQTSSYSSEPPSSGATKTNNSRITEWSEWSTNKPDSKSYRTIESKDKIKLQEIKSVNTTWKNISEEYLDEEELIKILNNNGYKVNTLKDISNNGELKYLIKMYIRDKKEISNE